MEHTSKTVYASVYQRQCLNIMDLDDEEEKLRERQAHLLAELAKLRSIAHSRVALHSVR